MKKFKFKSLAMRIWATYTVLILFIICSISFLYIVAYRFLDDKAKMNDLKVTHNIVLRSQNLEDKGLWDELKNLKGSNNFILKYNYENAEKIVNKKRIIYLMPKIYGVENWISGFIQKENMDAEMFKKSYKNTEYLFIISSFQASNSEQSYLISYMPNNHDNTFLYTVLIISVLFVGIGFFAAKFVANYISKPLQELEIYATRISHKDWTHPIQMESNDEIGRLANAMISMQRELKRADEEEKMFLQSISHDLKTPVAIILSHAQSIIDGIYIESTEHTAEIIKEESLRLEKKIKQLLYLNTLDYLLINQTERSCFSLDELLLNLVSRFQTMNSNITWEYNLADIMVTGCEEKLQIAIENILDNALRYADKLIHLSLKKEENSIILEIYNDGSKINESSVERIFDNLYKDKTGNFGLGLAITKKILNFHNGQIYALNKEGGVSFIIELPL